MATTSPLRQRMIENTRTILLTSTASSGRRSWSERWGGAVFAGCLPRDRTERVDLSQRISNQTGV